MKEVDDSYKGEKFYQQKNVELCAIIDGMETTDAMAIVTAFLVDAVGNSLADNDLDDARMVLDTIKSSVLDCLVANGWD